MSDLIGYEKAARNWSETEYREFVLKAVSDRWLRIMVASAALGLTILAALGTFYFSTIQGQIMEALKPDIKREVDAAISDNARTREIIANTVIREVNEYLGDDQAGSRRIEQIAAASSSTTIQDAIKQGGLLHEQVLKVALEAAKDRTGNVGGNLRALAIETYAMHLAGSDQAVNFRAELVALLAAELGQLPAGAGAGNKDVLTAIFANYPIAGHKSAACAERAGECAERDEEAMLAALEVLNGEPRPEDRRYMHAAAQMISKAPRRHGGVVTAWLSKTTTRADQAQRVLEAIARHEGGELVPPVAHYLGRELGEDRSAVLHDAIIGFALNLPMDAEIARTTRLQLVGKLWATAGAEDRQAVASGRIDRPDREGDARHRWAAWRGETPSTAIQSCDRNTGTFRPPLLTCALANLIRPGRHDAHEILKNDWLALGHYNLDLDDNEVAAAAIRVLAHRMEMEAPRSSDPDPRLQLAADWTLGLAVRDMHPSVADAVAIALKHGSEDVVRAYANTITNTETDPEGSSPDDWRPVFQALLERDRRGLEEKGPYGWLALLLSPTTEDRPEPGVWRGFVLETVIFPQDRPDGTGLESEGPTLEKDLVSWLAGAAAAQDPALAAVLTDEIERRLSPEHPQYSQMVAALENAGPLPDTELVERVRARLPWISGNFRPVNQLAASQSKEIFLQDIMDAKADGGWWGILPADRNFSLHVDRLTVDEVELVLFDPSRSAPPVRRTINRNAPSHIEISEGSHFLAIRIPGAAGKSLEGTPSLRVTAADIIVDSSPGSVVPVDRVPVTVMYDKGETPDEARLDLTLQAGQHLRVTTASAGDGGRNPDTVLHLYDADGELLRRNDDYGNSWFSQIDYQAPEQMDVQIHVNQFEDQPFDPGTRFLILIDENPPAPEDQRRAEN